MIVPSEFIGAIIGKGGETIQKIQKETGASVNIDEIPNPNGEGTVGVVDIASNNAEAMAAAKKWIEGIVAVPEAGTVYHGKVVSILEFGAFVEILPGKEGLLHVSEIAWNKTENVEDVLKVGDEIDVKLLEIDAKTGKMRLSMRALTEKPEGYVDASERKPRGDRGPRRDGDRRDDRRNDRGPRRDGDRRDDRRNDRGPRRDDRPRRDFGRKSEEPHQEEPKNEPEMF